jgi:hypothetical protein
MISNTNSPGSDKEGGNQIGKEFEDMGTDVANAESLKKLQTRLLCQ